MAVNIGLSLREGLNRAFSRNGVLLIVAWTIIVAASFLAYNSWFAAIYANLPAEPMLIGPSFDVPPLYAGIATVLLYLVSLVFTAGALRTFVTDNTQTLPGSHFTRNLGWMLLNLIVGFIVFYVALWIGFILLIVPGLFLFVSLFFWYVLVIVEDQNFYEAFENSWALAKGDRWTLLGIGLIVTVAGWIVMGIPMGLSFVLPEWVGFVLVGIAASVYGVFSVATVARVYVQLSTSQTTGSV